tara:strand:+ start:491 stop:814 length:324 start_codon:yes stop_codon:yes gene_type:complete
METYKAFYEKRGMQLDTCFVRQYKGKSKTARFSLDHYIEEESDRCTIDYHLEPETFNSDSDLMVLALEGGAMALNIGSRLSIFGTPNQMRAMAETIIKTLEGEDERN